MKKFITSIVLLCLFSATEFAQVTVQGTITDPAPGDKKVQVYGRNSSDMDLTNVLFGNINITLSIADQGANNPTEGQIVKASLIPSLDLAATDGNNPYILNGRAYYSYVMNNISTVTTTSTWPAGSKNNPIAEFTFPADTYFPTMRLEDLSPTGGPNSQMFWYVQVNGPGDITDYNAMFYGDAATPPTNNGTTGPSFVSLQPFSVLPVKFLSFNAIKNNNSAFLTWQIQNESSLTDHYDVERSFNGVDFAKVNTIAPKNNGNPSNTYDIADINLSLIRKAGVFYYRIRQVDKDGHFIYSSIKSVRLNANGIVIGVYPNPIKNLAKVSVDVENDAVVSVTINDESGKLVQSNQWQLFKGPNVKQINVESLAAGRYLLKLQTASEIKTVSIVKAN